MLRVPVFTCASPTSAVRRRRCAWCRRGRPAAARRCTPLHGAVPGGLQHRRHLTGANPFLARQSRAVLHHQARRGDALARQPLPHHRAARRWASSPSALLRNCAPMERNNCRAMVVVTVFVDVADDLDQVWRERPRRSAWRCAVRSPGGPCLDAAAQFLPDAAHRAGGVAGVVEQRHVGLRATAPGNLSGGQQGGAVELGHRAEAQLSARLGRWPARSSSPGCRCVRWPAAGPSAR